MQRLFNIIDGFLGGATALLMAVSVLNVVWQVFTRFVLGDPSSFTEELARYLLVWLGFLGGAYAGGRRRHLAVGLLPNRLGPRGRAVLRVIVEVLTAAFALSVLIGGGGYLSYTAFELRQTSAALNLPLGYVYLAVPVSGCFVFVYAVYFLFFESHDRT